MFKTGFPDGSEVKNLPAMQETQEMRVQLLGQEGPLEEGMATLIAYCSILAEKTAWTGEPGRLQYLGLQRGGHNPQSLMQLSSSSLCKTWPPAN